MSSRLLSALKGAVRLRVMIPKFALLLTLAQSCCDTQLVKPAAHAGLAKPAFAGLIKSSRKPSNRTTIAKAEGESQWEGEEHRPSLRGRVVEQLV